MKKLNKCEINVNYQDERFKITDIFVRIDSKNKLTRVCVCVYAGRDFLHYVTLLT